MHAAKREETGTNTNRTEANANVGALNSWAARLSPSSLLHVLPDSQRKENRREEGTENVKMVTKTEFGEEEGKEKMNEGSL